MNLAEFPQLLSRGAGFKPRQLGPGAPVPGYVSRSQQAQVGASEGGEVSWRSADAKAGGSGGDWRRDGAPVPPHPPQATPGPVGGHCHPPRQPSEPAHGAIKHAASLGNT